MSRSWTPKQKLAIETRGKTLLVSAAAGSGKTATLTERIVRAITDKNYPSSISKMLIVTFTRLSASDLKRKISDAISDELAKDPTSLYLSKQLVLLESAHICTIDSFYLDIVRSNFQRLSLPSSFRLADEGEMVLLRREVMDEIIEKHYDSSTDENDEFLSFAENFTSAKQSDTLSDIFLALQNKLCSRTDGTGAVLSMAEELRREANGEFFESRQGSIILAQLQNAARSYHEALCRCCDTICASSPEAEASYLPTFAYEKAFWGELLQILEKKSYSLTREKLLSFNKQKLKSLKAPFKTDELALCRALRDEETAYIKECTKKYFSFNEEEIRGFMKKTADILSSLHTVLAKFEERALEEKIKRRAFGFDDIRYFAFRLLTNPDGSPSDIALAYREQFDEIYIDEYQDVDAMQDRIFSLISRGNNRFMVGDIKQSIYSFRGADPDVFAHYKKTFPPIELGSKDENALIFMSNNFRCDENVIKFTNKVFSYLFGYCGESIEYTPEDDLIFSKIEPERTLPSPEVKITVITDELGQAREKKPDSDGINPEAIWIANEISRLIKYERKADGTPIEPGDIAILMRATTPAADISRALSELSIPCSDNSKYELFETPDVLLALSLLSAIDNPHRDIPLTATLYSPLFRYTMDELILIRTSADPSCSLFEALCDYEKTEDADEGIIVKNRFFLDKLSSYRSLAAALHIDKLLNHLYRDLSMNALGEGTEQNLTRLYEMARQFEAGSFKGLNNFISYINELIEKDKVPSLSYEDSDKNAVQMITAHKSKGLEFPVCFICNTQSRFNMEDVRLNMLYHANAGIALKLAYAGGMAKLETPLCHAVSQLIENNQLEEEMRILYVALTRARERLYITGKYQYKFENLSQKALLQSTFASDFEVRGCGSWLSMILAALYPLEDGDGYTIEHCDKGEIEFDYSLALASGNENTVCSAKSAYDIEELRERIGYRYPHEHLSRLPAKLSVSKLTPTVLDDMDDDAATLEAFDEAKILEIEEFFESKRGTTHADRGTATHLFLQFCDFENAARNGAERELSRLLEKKFISPEIARLIDLSQIKKFFESKFYAELGSADKVYRETRFNILLPASRFTQDKSFGEEIEGEEILVQGVIDLFFTDADGRIVLCDYKTDHLTKDELSDESLVIKKMTERHAKQLEYYAMAIERLLGKAPDKVVIYSLPFGESVEIPI